MLVVMADLAASGTRRHVCRPQVCQHTCGTRDSDATAYRTKIVQSTNESKIKCEEIMQ